MYRGSAAFATSMLADQPATENPTAAPESGLKSDH